MIGLTLGGIEANEIFGHGEPPTADDLTVTTSGKTIRTLDDLRGWYAEMGLPFEVSPGR